MLPSGWQSYFVVNHPSVFVTVGVMGEQHRCLTEQSSSMWRGVKHCDKDRNKSQSLHDQPSVTERLIVKGAVQNSNNNEKKKKNTVQCDTNERKKG